VFGVVQDRVARKQRSGTIPRKGKTQHGKTQRAWGFGMDIPSIDSVTALHQVLAQQRLDMAVMAKANDVAKAQGDMALELLDAATETSNQASGDHDSLHGLDLIA